jgi:hypothetical protein
MVSLALDAGAACCRVWDRNFAGEVLMGFWISIVWVLGSGAGGVGLNLWVECEKREWCALENWECIVYFILRGNLSNDGAMRVNACSMVRTSLH